MLKACWELRESYFDAKLSPFLVVRLCRKQFPILNRCDLAHLKWTCASGNCAKMELGSSSQASHSRYWSSYSSILATWLPASSYKGDCGHPTHLWTSIAVSTPRSTECGKLWAIRQRIPVLWKLCRDVATVSSRLWTQGRTRCPLNMGTHKVSDGRRLTVEKRFASRCYRGIGHSA